MTMEDKKFKDVRTAQQKVQATRRIPWWVSILGAITTYCTLKYILPDLNPANQTLQDLFKLGPPAAPVLTIPFLLLAAKQLYDVDTPSREDGEDSEK